MNRWIWLIVLACLPLWLAGCGGGGGGSDKASITLTPANASVEPGKKITFTATVANSADKRLIWSAEPKQSLPAGDSIRITDGEFTAPRTPGQVVIRAYLASNPTVVGSATVTVMSGSPTSLTVTPDAITIAPSQQRQLQAVLPDNTSPEVTWRVVEGATGGSVSSSGLYTAPAVAGVFHVEAVLVSNPAITAQCTVNVRQTPKLTVSPDTAIIAPTSTLQFNVDLTGLEDTTISWDILPVMVISNGELVQVVFGSIDQTGLYVSPAREGSYTIRARSNQNPQLAASAIITVDARRINLQLDPLSNQLAVGERHLFAARITNPEMADRRITWSITNESGRICDENGQPFDAGKERPLKTDSEGRLEFMSFLPGQFTIRAASAAMPSRYEELIAHVASEFNREETFTLPNGSRLTMVYVPAGKFLQGAGPNEAYQWEDEKPQHQVYLSGYWIGKYEITRNQYEGFIAAGGRKPVYWEDPRFWGDPPFSRKGDCPVVGISYDDAVAFCNWLSANAQPRATFRLPTESQWEKAARWDGHSRIYPWGDFWDPARCNHADDPVTHGNQIAPVGTYPAGASFYGCHDMAGNAWEWCHDWYNEVWYMGRDAFVTVEPTGPNSGSLRVVRGGHFGFQYTLLRCADRYAAPPTARNDYFGLRVAIWSSGGSW